MLLEPARSRVIDMKSYRTVHQVLFVLAFIPMLLGLGLWYITILLPLALIVPYGINEMIIARRERVEAEGHSTPLVSAIEHAYRE